MSKQFKADIGPWNRFVELSGKDTPTGGLDHSRSPEKSMWGEDERGGWYGTKNFPEALKLAKEGWPEGRKLIESMSVQFREMLTNKVFRPVLVHDVWGDTVDVGRFAAGLPDTMMHWQSSDLVARGFGQSIVHIVFNMTVSWSVSTEAIRNRGAAVVALVDALEMAGKRVKIDLVYAASLGRNDTAEQMAIWTNVKQPDMPLQIDQLAFSLCHPSAFRRIGFGVAEQMPPDIRRGLSSYGRPPFDVLEKSEEGDIYMSSGSLQKTNWNDHKSCIAWIEGQLKKYGVLIEEDEHYER